GPPAPTPLAPADGAGTWNGTTYAANDSATAHWTVKNTTDSTGTFTPQGAKAGAPYTMKFDGDSLTATSVAYNDPTLPKGTGKVVFTSVGRLKDGKLGGTVVVHLASKPDSVVMRARWDATKAP